MPGVGFMVRVAVLGSCVAVELIPGGVDSACYPSEVRKMSTSLVGSLSHSSILYQSGDLSRSVPNSPGDCSGSTNTAQRMELEYLLEEVVLLGLNHIYCVDVIDFVRVNYAHMSSHVFVICGVYKEWGFIEPQTLKKRFLKNF